MAAGKERIITCAECGVEVATRYSRTMFCPECAERRSMEAIRKSNERKKRERMENRADPEEPIHLCDSPERIKVCLNCQKPYCNNCFGQKDKGHILPTTRKAPVQLMDIKADLIQAIKRGDSNRTIYDQFNISSTTLSRWVRKLKEEGALE